jgi:hypothetical protein
MRKFLILITAVLLAFAGMNAASAGSLESPWDEPEITQPRCTPMGILGVTLWRSCPTADTPYTSDRPDSPDGTTTTTTTTDDDDDNPGGGNDPKDDKPDNGKKPKSNASNHASKKADNNDGKGGKDRDTSKNSDKGTHGNRSP